MATEWFYKQSDAELGPYLFREMVEMVREERLLPETMVRPSYMNEWQRADSVVGLFYMARRDPETLPPVQSLEINSADDFADVNDLDAFLETSAEVPEPEGPLTDTSNEIEKPGWLKRLLSLRSSKIPPVPVDPERELPVGSLHRDRETTTLPGTEAQTGSGLKAEPATGESTTEPDFDFDMEELTELADAAATGAFSADTWSSAVNAAVERVDARAPRQESQPAARQIIPAFHFSFLESLLFRKLMFAGAVIFCLTAAIYGFVNWMGQGTLLFPFIGACSPLMFLIYAALTLIVVIAVGSLLIFLSSSWLRVGFKFGAVFLMANLTAVFLLNWSHEQANLFPSRKPVEASLVFPFMGECSAFAYWMYFVDVVIFVGVATYFLASWLEAQADDV